jgi:hypothetical protein
MALFGRNFILLVEEGVELPANLQGFYECRYGGDELDMPTTMKLFKAFNYITRSKSVRPLLSNDFRQTMSPPLPWYDRTDASIQE